MTLLEKYAHLLPKDEEKVNGELRKSTKGRSKVNIDETQLIKLAMLGCTTNEIGDFFDVDGSVIRKRYNRLLKGIKAETLSSIRRAQIETALNGNAALLIWLGKNMLKQSDTGERNSEDNQILPWSDD